MAQHTSPTCSFACRMSVLRTLGRHTALNTSSSVFAAFLRVTCCCSAQGSHNRVLLRALPAVLPLHLRTLTRLPAPPDLLIGRQTAGLLRALMPVSLVLLVLYCLSEPGTQYSLCHCTACTTPTTTPEQQQGHAAPAFSDCQETCWQQQQQQQPSIRIRPPVLPCCYVSVAVCRCLILSTCLPTCHS
jgi:hypothetical protein